LKSEPFVASQSKKRCDAARGLFERSSNLGGDGPWNAALAMCTKR